MFQSLHTRQLFIITWKIIPRATKPRIRRFLHTLANNLEEALTSGHCHVGRRKPLIEWHSLMISLWVINPHNDGINAIPNKDIIVSSLACHRSGFSMGIFVREIPVYNVCACWFYVLPCTLLWCRGVIFTIKNGIMDLISVVNMYKW